MQLLTESTHLNTIIDLRTKTELERVPTKRADGNPVAVVSGATVYNIPYINDAYIRKALLSKLPWHRFIQVIVYHILGFRTAVAKIVSRLVIVPMGLRGIAYECVKWLGPEIQQTFSIFSDESRYPTLIHCTQGKDRTGLAILLVLLVLLGENDAGVKAIDYDYMLSNDGLKGLREEMIKEMRPFGYTDEFLEAQEGWVEVVVGFIEERGGIEKYLASVGVNADDLDRIRHPLSFSYELPLILSEFNFPAAI
ncbi:hypothetical protein H072_4528 [Dactylellina haptotyla CBS 200.50]|uniref:Tyrosine specific protein phosphatases domain-containing protein n=1 Tax=Dactylellina haptotyla (strain CBS 200.50) TaxID=1284197 RepID=S8AF77_DACHA|nr:hypothetical protein H072_4528 [Dactylellina haptotyla CBS 200.50]